ncbi:hypothetical protein U370_04155 [Anaplasma marginale str. Dawn]|nr:hypothetical protein U128_04310 [Anaplasma marginale str. Gypsy Plains]AGZ79945.1 hypothetical protein U370_04155 [Anaplasma marginale str. Dawn]
MALKLLCVNEESGIHSREDVGRSVASRLLEVLHYASLMSGANILWSA